VSALQLRFRQLGCEVVVAHDAVAALNLAQVAHPDLVCLDVGMPAGSGLSVCEMLLAHQELSEVPVIMLTGRSDEETIRRCHNMCAYYVLKSDDVWKRIESIALELLDIVPSERNESGNRASANASRGLRSLCCSSHYLI